MANTYLVCNWKGTWLHVLKKDKVYMHIQICTQKNNLIWLYGARNSIIHWIAYMTAKNVYAMCSFVSFDLFLITFSSQNLSMMRSTLFNCICMGKYIDIMVEKTKV